MPALSPGCRYVDQLPLHRRLQPSTWGVNEPARRHGVSGRVAFAGPVSDEALPAHYRGADAVAVPSLYEGFGLPALEAMACGVPVVAANATALPEVVGDAGVLVDPYDVDAIADGLARAVGDPAVRAECRSRGLERAARFSWERTASLTQTALDRAAASRG